MCLRERLVRCGVRGGRGNESCNAKEKGASRPDSVDVKVLAAAERALQKCNNQHTRADDLTRALAPERRRFEAENFTNCGGNAGCLVQSRVCTARAVPNHVTSDMLK